MKDNKYKSQRKVRTSRQIIGLRKKNEPRTHPKRITVLDSDGNNRRISYDALERRAEAHLTLNTPNDLTALKSFIDHYDGRQVIVRSSISDPIYLQGELVKDSSYRDCYGIGLPDRSLVADHQPYRELIDIFVLKKK